MADNVENTAAPSPPAPNKNNNDLHYTQDSSMTCDNDTNNYLRQKEEFNNNYLNPTSPYPNGANNTYLTQPLFTSSPTQTQCQSFPLTPTINNTNS
jgi:hypothetical protein